MTGGNHTIAVPSVGRQRSDHAIASAILFLDDRTVADYCAGLLTCDEVTQRVNLALQRHQPAEHAGDAFLQGDQSVSAADGIGANSIDDRLGDRQVIGDLGVEGNEIHRVLRFVARAVTRYVAGALFFVAAWQLQRMGWVRRAAMLRPSDTTTSGGAA